MKRILKILLPGAIMVSLVFCMRGGKDILTGLYIVFPILYIAAGVVCSGFTRELLPCLLLTSIAFLIPVNCWFHMGSCVDLTLIYIALGCISHWFKARMLNRRTK